MSKANKPILALAELIWNGLDADATEVRVTLGLNELGGLDTSSVTDNGQGIRYADAVAAFGNLGGSWKRNETCSKNLQRLLHGKTGRERF